VTVLGRVTRDRRRRGPRRGFAASPGKHDELSHIGRPPNGGHDLGSLGEVRPDGRERAVQQLGHGEEQEPGGQRDEGSFLSRAMLQPDGQLVQ
jgi:hypothetical protein